MSPKPLFKDRICAVVAAPLWRGIGRALATVMRLTATVEVRLDYLRDSTELMRCMPDAPGSRLTRIATCRHRNAGGRFEGKWTSQFSVLLHAIVHDYEWCDAEVELARHFDIRDLRRRFEPVSPIAPESDLGKVIRKARSIGVHYREPQPRLLLSSHDFRRTPRKLGAIVRELEKYEPHAIKIATQCNSYADALRVLALCKGRRNVIAVPMGEIGLPARVLALRHGSALAYAAVGEKTAPGQLTLDEMKHLYRADKLDRRTRVYGVIGNPVSHSLSPLLHNTGFIARRMNDVYLPFLVPDLRDFLRAVKPLGIHGFSVTLPHKQAILRHLDDCDPLAEAIGAVNTVVVRGGGKLYGYNTDYVGVLRALQRRVTLRGSRVLIYGAGGAARATAFALAQTGAIVNICARRPAEAQKLARAAGGEAIARRHLRREFFDAIVNTTPVGMHPHAGASPLRAEELNCRLVFDSVYRPMKTRLLRLAERRGIETVSGVEMFLAQGTAQWEIWTGLRAPEKQMREAVLKRLRAEDRPSRK